MDLSPSYHIPNPGVGISLLTLLLLLSLWLSFISVCLFTYTQSFLKKKKHSWLKLFLLFVSPEIFFPLELFF